ncbi:MAG: hypothetical protein QOF62_2796 [Pyrinomonadaceae bacterium]|nr:hypothetical protein [Pyrinomonadaceae bacterium]
MLPSTAISATLPRNAIQLALLLGMFSVGVLAAEPLNDRSTLAQAPGLSLHYSPHVGFQPEDGWALIKTDDGVLFVWNVHELHFTVSIKGKDVKQVADPDHIFLTVDGKMLQIQAAEIREFAPDAKEKKLDDKAVLAAHREWESKYLEGLLKSKLTLKSFNVNMSALGPASLWAFDMPEGMNAEVKTQLYVTVLRGDYVVMLNCEATTTTSEVEVRKFLLDTMATLKTSAEPIDVQKLSQSIRAGKKP